MPDSKLESSGSESETSGNSEALLSVIADIQRELHPGNTQLAVPRLDSRLSEELGLDSLARVELGQRIERELDLSLPERLMFDAETPRDLWRAMLKAGSGKTLDLRALSASAQPLAVSDFPDQAKTLIEMLQWHVERHGQRPHIQFYDDYTDGEVITYAELYTNASRLAAEFQRKGLLVGETVAVMLATGRDYFYSFFAIILAGAIPVPIYPPVRRQQLEDHLRRQSRILAQCRAAMLVTSSDAIVPARLLTASVASLRGVFTVDELRQSEQLHERVVVDQHDTAFIQFTSGSTGDPKGVVLSHHNLLSNIRADGRGMAVRSDDVFVSWLPLYHDMGLIGAWLGSLYHAIRFVVMPPLSFLSRPERWLRAIHRYGGTLSAAPNFAYEQCLKRIDLKSLEGLDLSAWRLTANGAEAISAVTMEAFCERFAVFGFKREAMLPVYGLAECSVGLAFSPLGRGPLIDHIDRQALSQRGLAVPVDRYADDQARLDLVACGQPLPGHEIRIVDSADREQAERTEGRVQFRGPSATAGYFERPDANALLFSGDWLNSGDRGYIAGGDLYITGRDKDIIIRAGRNLYPPELEDAIGDIDGIRKGHVAVFGVASGREGTERVVVLAESRRRGDEVKQGLLERVNALSETLFGGPVDELVLAPPNTVLRTSSGKIRRAACRDIYLAGQIGLEQRPAWVQFGRLVLAGVIPQCKRAGRNAAAWLFAGWAWCVFTALALLAWVAAWLPIPVTALWRITRTLARAAARLTATELNVDGLDQLPASGQAVVVVANHQSYLDGMLMVAALPRPASFMVKGELAQSRLLARPLARLGALFVDRFDAGAGMAGIDEAIAVLDGGGLLVVFAEGTFKRMPGLLPFHMGAFNIASRAGVSLVPAAIRGTRSILRSDQWFPRRGAISLSFRPPIKPIADADLWAQATALRDSARAAILAHCGEPDLAHESNRVENAATPARHSDELDR